MTSMDPLAGSQWSASGTVAGFAKSAPNAVLMKFAEEELRRSGSARALDLGCGAGRNAVPLARLGWKVVGIDLSWPMLCAAATRTREDRLDDRLHLVLAPMEQYSREGPQLRPRDRSRHLEPRAFRGAVPAGARRGGPCGQARGGTVRVHLLAEHLPAADGGRGGANPSCSPSSPASRSASSPRPSSSPSWVVSASRRIPAFPSASTIGRSRGPSPAGRCR